MEREDYQLRSDLDCGTCTLRIATRKFFRVYDPADVDAPRFRARQLAAMLRLTPLAMSVNAVNAIVLNLVLRDQVNRLLLGVWTALIFVSVVLGVHGWIKARRRPARATASSRAIRRATAQALLLGIVWGALPALTFPDLDANAQFCLGLVITGMICGGGLALSSVPSAATSFVVSSGLGGIWALAFSHTRYVSAMFILIAAYCALVVYSIWTQARTFGAQMVAEACAERQNELIGLLLKDFEDHTSDLLWETDQRGCLVRVSARLQEALGMSARRLSKVTALAVLRRFGSGDEVAHGLWLALRALLGQPRPFTDVQIVFRGSGEQRWWSLSARPLFNEAGILAGWRGVASDITDKHNATRQLRWLANNDSLTGLVNRHQFRELLSTLLSSDRGAVGFAVLCFDLDGFKQINDVHGHAAGDALLTEFGQRLLRAARRTDTVARLGGDEFAMVLRGNVEYDDIETLLTRFQTDLRAPCSIGGQIVPLRTSIGVARSPGDGCDYDTLLNHADMALYDAKQSGGDCFRFFFPELGDRNRRRFAIAQALRGALERNEFYVEYQPQISAADDALVGFEALLRWHPREFGEISPSEFVPIAESIGLMQEVGDWVLMRACTDAATWPRPIPVSVNVSSTQLTAPGFVGRVAQLTRALPPERVELEVTESVLIDDSIAAVSALNKLRAAGYRTALDDFGTGYSALSYLRRFSFDAIKIDRSFVRDLALDGEAQVLVETILAMARSLRMRTIAEGVEDIREAEMLAQRGCTALQGYLVGRAMRPERVAAFIDGWNGLSRAGPPPLARVA